MRILLLILISSCCCLGQTYLPSNTAAFISTYVGVGNNTITANDVGIDMKYDIEINNNGIDNNGTFVRITDSFTNGAIWHFDGNTATSQKYDFLHPSVTTLSFVGSPTNSDSGVTTNGTSSYVNTNFNPSTKSIVNLGMGLVIREVGTTSFNVNGGNATSNAGTNGVNIQAWVSGNNAFGGSNSNAQVSFSNSSRKGYWHIQRISGGQTFSLNGVQKITGAQSFVASVNQSITIGAWNVAGTVGFFTADNFACAWISSGALTTAMITSLYNAESNRNLKLSKPR